MKEMMSSDPRVNTAVTQVRRPWRTTVRTVFQAVVALASGAPLIYEAVANDNTGQATGGFAVVLGVSAAITRVMALPFVEEFLQKYIPWLAAEQKHAVPSQ